MSAEFVKWWLQTDFGKKKRLNWEVSRRADCWTGFQQVAHTKDGKPGVMCNRCRTVLTHSATSNTGNSSMQSHLEGPRCRQRITKKGNIQQPLSDAADGHVGAPLQAAASWHNHIEIVRKLLDKCALVNFECPMSDYFGSALVAAAERGNLEVVIMQSHNDHQIAKPALSLSEDSSCLYTRFQRSLFCSPSYCQLSLDQTRSQSQ
ncbi:hypothetical protein N7471_010766 [Penicillium samsonianum]|uniref:uncharacterized protein n=1 Tax=Penicillium samsonianum TaxID=1882272 RepID=UPI00254725CD|nr:uncharacterized protein N7471_010766 [Penicillium samsonianum]KAJ6126273.1 hypothetical protein N7471_010766 [Penicillium samsonianum]